GGAALAAVLAARYERPVTLIAPMPQDAEAARLGQLLRGQLELIGIPWAGRTSVKTRLLAGGHTVVRLDRGGGEGPRVAGVPESTQRALRDAAAILVADYGGGATAHAALRDLLAERVT